MFEFDFTDDLREKLRRLSKRDKKLASSVSKKITEIVSRDLETIDAYKNLRAPLNDFKRLHIGSYVLLFKVFKEKRFIRFVCLKHHDEAYEI